MHSQYGLSDSQKEYLDSKGISVKDLFYFVKDFNVTEAPASKISLMHYIDIHGDFTERKRKSKKDMVAECIFNNLTAMEKVEIGEYLNWYEFGEDDKDGDSK